nr:hypothetical protein [Tanacetum cinerariifolium]
MAALVISISSDVSVESVRSSFSRVILIGSIFVEVLVALEVGGAAVASPSRVLEVDTHSSSEADPLESSPPPISVAPMVSPFLCSNDSELDTEIPERNVSPTTSTLEIPTAPILPAPSEFPLAHALRYTSHHLDHFTSGSSSSHSFSDHSLPRKSSSDHSLSGHTPPDTTDADSSTPQRFVHPPLARTPRYYVVDFDPEEDLEDDQADYPTDGRDGNDEPSDDHDDDDTDDEDPEEDPFEDEEDDEEEEEHLAPADSSTVPIIDPVLPAGDTETLEADEPTHTPGSPIIIPLSQTRPPLGYRAAKIKMRALLPSTSRMTNIPKANMSPQKRAFLTTPALGFENGESFAAGAARQPGPTKSDLRRYRVEQVGYGITDTWNKIVDTLMEIAPTTLEGVNERVTELDTTVRQRTDEFEIRFEEAHDDRALLRARVNTLFRDRPNHRRAAMLMDREAMDIMYGYQCCYKMAPKKRTTRATPATTTITYAQLQALIDQGVDAALAERDADRSRNGDNSNDSGTGGRRQMTTPRECTYTDFLKCQPTSFQGTEGVI